MTRDPAPRGTVSTMGQDSERASRRAPAIGDYFFVVYRVESPNPQRRYTVPTYKHATYQEADAEARRLAEENPGAAFAILEVKAVRRSKAQRRRVKLKR